MMLPNCLAVLACLPSPDIAARLVAAECYGAPYVDQRDPLLLYLLRHGATRAGYLVIEHTVNFAWSDAQGIRVAPVPDSLSRFSADFDDQVYPQLIAFGEYVSD
jgi:hypothetical protein